MALAFDAGRIHRAGGRARSARSVLSSVAGNAVVGCQEPRLVSVLAFDAWRWFRRSFSAPVAQRADGAAEVILQAQNATEAPGGARRCFDGTHDAVGT